MTVIDLRAERRRRQAERADFNARVLSEARAEIALIEREAERGFAAAGPVADPEIRGVIHRSILRGVRAKIQKNARERQADPDTIASLVETAERIYDNRVFDLSNRRMLGNTETVP